MRRFAAATRAAKTHWNRDHSNDPTGARGEDIPRWASVLFPLFEAEDAVDSHRRNNCSVVNSLTGAQAPLGACPPDGSVAELRTETTRNAGNCQ